MSGKFAEPKQLICCRHLIPVMTGVLVPVMPIVLRTCFLGWRAWC